MIIAVSCKECRATGRNGTLGGYALLCAACQGLGWRFADYTSTSRA